MDTPLTTPAAVVQYIPIEQLKPNPWNRTTFDPTALEELVASIKVGGVEEPLTVRLLPSSVPATYEIASGHRRWLAAQKAGLTEVPCLVRELTDQKVAEMNIELNIQRENIAPLQMARMVWKYMDRFKKNQQQAADTFGKSRVWVTTLLGFLEIDSEALKYVSALTLSWHQLAALKGLPPGVQRQIADEVRTGDIKPDKIEKRCRQFR